jgi:hypothetical protein
MGLLGQPVLDTTVDAKGNRQTVFERYTDATRRAIFYAWQECQRRDESAITVGDLLCGLTVEEDTRAERIASLKTNALYLRWLLGVPPLPALHPDSSKSIDETELDLDITARRACAFALMEADRDREYWIDSDHLLRGLLRFPNKAHFALLKTEISLSSVRTDSRHDREKCPPQEKPNPKVFRYMIGKYVALVIPPILSLVCYLYILMQGFGRSWTPLAK